MNYRDVDDANRRLDQEEDFKLDSLEDEDGDAEEKAERVAEHQRIAFFLMETMALHDLAPIPARFMEYWTSERCAYYKDEESKKVSLFYRGFEITRHGNQWFLDYEDNNYYSFWDASLRHGLNAIDGNFESGELK